MRRQSLGTAAVMAAVLLAPLTAAAAPSPAPRSIAVSVPSEPVPFHAGDTGRIMIRVLDPTQAPVTVTVTGMGVELGDNGKVTFTGAPDPAWVNQADFPAGSLVIPAMSYIDVYVTVRMPATISPDLYYVGFVVRPVPTGPGVKVVNQIGGFFSIDVPGPRARSLAANLDVQGFNLGPIHLADFVLGSQVKGQLAVRNTGQAAVQFWGENDVTSWVVTTPLQARIAKSLVPIARSRNFPVSASPGLLIDMVTLSVRVSYPSNTDSATTDIVIERQILVVSPWAIVILCGLILLLTAWRLRARARRRARARDRAQGPRSRHRQPG